MIIIGIDPGLSGAICILDSVRGVIAIHDVPTIPKPTKGKGKKTVNNRLLGDIFQAIDPRNTMVVVEKVGAMPNQGLSSTFNFGKSAGFFTGAAHALPFLSYQEVMPAVWKRHHSLIGFDKGGSRARAAYLFPKHAAQFARVKDDGRAEACLIAQYAADKLLFKTHPLSSHSYDVI